MDEGLPLTTLEEKQKKVNPCFFSFFLRRSTEWSTALWRQTYLSRVLIDVPLVAARLAALSASSRPALRAEPSECLKYCKVCVTYAGRWVPCPCTHWPSQQQHVLSWFQLAPPALSTRYPWPWNHCGSGGSEDVEGWIQMWLEAGCWWAVQTCSLMASEENDESIAIGLKSRRK